MIKKICFAGLLLFSFYVQAVFAHGVNLFCYREGLTLHGEGYYSRGRPVKEAKVDIFGKRGKLVASTHTDEEGRFTVKLMRMEEIKAILYAGQGHQGQCTVPVEQGEFAALQAEGAPQPKTSDPNQSGPSDQTRLQDWRKERDAVLARTSAVNTILGLGMILGVFYLIYWWKKNHAS